MQLESHPCAGSYIFATLANVIKDTQPLFAEISNSIDVSIGRIWYHRNRLLDAFDVVDEVWPLQRLRHRIWVGDYAVHALRKAQVFLSYRPLSGMCRCRILLRNNVERYPTDPVYSHISEELVAVSHQLRGHRRRLGVAMSICRAQGTQYFRPGVFFQLLVFLLDLTDHALTYLSYAHDLLLDWPCELPL